MNKKLSTQPTFKIALECPLEFVDFPNSIQRTNNHSAKAIPFIKEFFNQHV